MSIAVSTRPVSLVVNGQVRRVEVAPRRTLAELLRENLGLTGTKIGCNRAECGSCTVVLDSRAVFSCSVLAVEGLAGPDGLHPLQSAFIEHDAVQCGACIPGILMSLKALLDDRLDGSGEIGEQDVREAVGGNLCRCGTYPNTVKATLAAARALRAGRGARP